MMHEFNVNITEFARFDFGRFMSALSNATLNIPPPRRGVRIPLYDRLPVF